MVDDLDQRLAVIETHFEQERRTEWHSGTKDACTAFIATIAEARAILKANMTPGWMCKCGVFNGSTFGRDVCRCCGAWEIAPPCDPLRQWGMLEAGRLMLTQPDQLSMNPVDAYALGWRPTEEDAAKLGWVDGKPPEKKP